MTNCASKSLDGFWLELHCPTDGALLLRFANVPCGTLEGKCRKCKEKHVFGINPDGSVQYIVSYK